MPDSLVAETMRSFQAGILAREQLQTAQLVRGWMHVEDKLQADIDALARDLAAEKAAGRATSQAKLYRMARYQTLLGQLHTEVGQYVATTADSITATQLELAGLGIDQAAQAIELSSPTIHASFNRLPVSAVHNMVGLAGDGSPLKTLLAASYPDAVEGITSALIRGTALGWHPTKTAAAMRQGSEMGLQRSLTIARTEQLRVLRTASQMQYQASGVVKALMWLCANSSRTCLACLAKSGKLIPLNEPFFDHVNGRCTAVPILINRPLPTFQTGQQWFELQDETTQREMMGPGRFTAWKDGAFKFEDLAKVTSDPTWGKSLGVRPLKSLTAVPKLPPPPTLADFKPHATIASLEQWCAQALPNMTVDFTGVHIENANDVIGQLGKLSTSYPMVVERLGYLGTYQGKGFASNAASVWGKSDAYAHAGPPIVDATTGNVTRKGYIGFNPQYYGKTRAELDKVAAKDVAMGWHPKGLEKGVAIFTHEFGHQVDYYLQQAFGNQSFTPTVLAGGAGLFSTLYADVLNSKVTSKLSRYALTSAHEAFAESFAMIRHGKPSDWPAFTKRISTFLDIEREYRGKLSTSWKSLRQWPQADRASKTAETQAIWDMLLKRLKP